MTDERQAHEDAARWRKVAHLLAALYAHEVPPARVRRLGRRQWAVVAATARVKAPSYETVRLLREALSAVVPLRTEP